MANDYTHSMCGFWLGFTLIHGVSRAVTLVPWCFMARDYTYSMMFMTKV